jgi:hypothetical protein
MTVPLTIRTEIPGVPRHASEVPRGCRARVCFSVCAMLLLIAAIETTQMACDEGR